MSFKILAATSTLAFSLWTHSAFAQSATADCRNNVLGNAANIIICCPVILNGERLPPGTIICPMRGREPSGGEYPVLTPEQINQRLYITIMSHLNSQMIYRGRLAGRPFKATYANAARPKAVAMCISWTDTTPFQLTTKRTRSWQFVTGQGTCAPRNEQEAGQCALNECEQHASCDSGQKCTLIDINGRNVLAPPRDWLSSHSMKR